MVRYGDTIQAKTFFSHCCFHADGVGHGNNLSKGDSIFPRQAEDLLKALDVEGLQSYRTDWRYMVLTFRFLFSKTLLQSQPKADFADVGVYFNV